MVETIEVGCDGIKKWHWYNVQSDLLKCGSLDKELLSIDPLSTSANGSAGAYGGIRFHLTWVKDAFLLLTMDNYVPELVQALVAVLEYEPFVKYEHIGKTTVEWDKIDPDERLSVIKASWFGKGNVCDIRWYNRKRRLQWVYSEVSRDCSPAPATTRPPHGKSTTTQEPRGVR